MEIGSQHGCNQKGTILTCAGVIARYERTAAPEARWKRVACVAACANTIAYSNSSPACAYTNAG